MSTRTMKKMILKWLLPLLTLFALSTNGQHQQQQQKQERRKRFRADPRLRRHLRRQLSQEAIVEVSTENDWIEDGLVLPDDGSIPEDFDNEATGLFSIHSIGDEGRQEEKPQTVQEEFETEAIDNDQDDSNNNVNDRNVNNGPEIKFFESKRFIVECIQGRELECLEELRESTDCPVEIVHELPGTDFVAIATDDEECLDTLEDVLDYEEDSERSAMVLEDSIVYLDDHRMLMGGTQVVPYGIDLVKARKIWSEGRGRGVTVCIMDSGMSLIQEDAARARLSGTNAILKWAADGHGHGTHVAGTVIATDNKFGVVGVAPAAKAFIVRVFDNKGGFRGSDVVAAALECQRGGAQIINMSLGGSSSSSAERVVFQSLHNQGILSIAASGNSGKSDLSYPASYPHVMSVGAVDRNSRLTSFSTRNKYVNLVAPGASVVSLGLSKRGLVSMSGTSMATPHVAGVAALLKSIVPKATPQQLWDAMTNTAKGIGASGSGKGLVNAQAALTRLRRITAVCGNGIKEPGEQCDDGNTVNGDGCSSKCRTESTTDNTNGGNNNDNPCPDANEALFRINLRTDNKSYKQNSATLRNLFNNHLIWDFPRRYFRNQRTYVREVCLNKTKCYKFQFNDRQGDGLVGNNRGLRVIWDGNVKYDGKQTNRFIQIQFGEGCANL